MAEAAPSLRAPRQDGRHDRVFAAARQAYTRLRADRSVDNEAISKVDVAQVAGIPRQYLSLNGPDWQALGSAIKQHTAFDAPEVETLTSVAVQHRSARQRELDALAGRMRACEQKTDDIQRAFDACVLGPLVRELQHYMLLGKAQTLPSEQGKIARLHLDLEETRRDNEQLKARVRILTEGGALEALLDAQTQKRRIDVVPTATRGMLTVGHLANLYDDSFAAAARFAHNPDPRARPAVIYILSGNIGAGKSAWIKDHKPDRAGLHLYLDAPHHTAKTRRELAHSARSTASPCRVVCVWVRAPRAVCLDRNGSRARRAEGLAVRGGVVHDLHDVFEPVGVNEGFDAIEVVGDDDDEA